MPLKEGSLPEQFTSFNPESLAEIKTAALFYDFDDQHFAAFHCQLGLITHQFGISPDAAERVLGWFRPDRWGAPVQAGLPQYFEQLSLETGLNFRINPDLFTGEPTVQSLAGIFSAVYDVPAKKLYPAMEARVAAMKCLDRNDQETARYYYQENLIQYYTLLKQAIS